MKAIKFIQQLHKSQLFKQYFKWVLIFFTVPCFLFSAIMYSYYEINNNYVAENAFLEFTNRSVQTLNNTFGEIHKNYYFINSDKNIRNNMFLDENSFFLPENQASVSYLNSLLSYALNTSNVIDSIYLYSINNKYVYSVDKTQSISSNHFDKFTDLSWLQAYNNQTQSQLIIGRYDESCKSNVVSVIYEMYSGNVNTGFLVFNISEDTLKNLLISSNSKSAANVSLKMGNDEIFSTSSYDSEESLSKSNNTLFYSGELDFPNIMVTISLEQNNRNILSVILLVLFFLFFALIIPVIMSFVLSNNFYMSVSRITSYLLGFYPQDTNKKPEMDFVRNSINKIIKTSHNLEHSVANFVRDVQQAQLTSLQAQLNPHFLFNTLNSLSLMNSTDADKDTFELLIRNLSNILSYALDSENNIVPLQEEIKYTMDYIAIEEIKYSSKINVSFDIPNELINVSVPKFIFQPIIENSLKHGFKFAFDGTNNITICAKNKKNILTIKITDNGLGISDSKAANINSSLSDGCFPQHRHIGLYNTNKRIQLLYGKSFGCRILPAEKHGTQIIITLPDSHSK